MLISTATVALQEQLVHKDLPALVAQFEQPIRYALAKGRCGSTPGKACEASNGPRSA